MALFFDAYSTIPDLLNMIEVTIEADFRPERLGFEAGVAKAVGLLKALSAIPAFSGGWQAQGVQLLRDEAGFVAALQAMQAGDGADAGYHFAIAENVPGITPPFFPPESYIAEVSFDSVDGYLEVKLSLAQKVSEFQTLRGAMHVLTQWSALQHASAIPVFYAADDSPIDPVNRRGIGWVGWVPFEVTAEQLPEAQVLEAVGGGTLVASQDSYWDVTDRAAVKRAQALELALNKLGLLPTRDVLAEGTWGLSDQGR